MDLTVLPEGTTREEWNRIVSTFDDHNFYQSWEWGESKRTQGWKPLRIICENEGELLGVAQGFTRTLARRKWGVLWIPGGPLVLRGGGDLANVGNLEAVLSVIRLTICSRLKLVVRCAPYLFSTQLTRQALANVGFRNLQSKVFVYTFLVDLTNDLDALKAGFRKTWRHSLARCEKNRVEIRHGTTAEDFTNFYQIIRQSEKTKGFRSGLTQEQLLALAHFNDSVRLLVANENCRMVGGLIAAHSNERGLELFAGATPEGYRLNVSYGLMWESLRWLKTVGVQTYDLGGVDPEGAKGVYTFKAGLRGNLVEFVGQWEQSPSRLMTAGLHLLERLR